MKTGFKIATAAVVGFVAGCTAGFLFQSAGTTDGSAAGNIMKVSRFSKNVVSPEMSAFQEKIASDTTEYNKVLASLTVLTSRMTEFDELVSLTTLVTEGKEELASSMQNLLNVRQLAANARTNGTKAMEALKAISEGKKTDVNYEQASQNLSLAFMMVDRQISVGKQYVKDVDNYLNGKKAEDYQDLALTRDLWAGYCAGQAVLTNNSEDLAFWSKQENLLTSSTNSLAMAETMEKFDFAPLQQCLSIDSAAGLASGEFFMISNGDQLQKFSNSASERMVLANNEAQRFIVRNAEQLQTFNDLSNVRQVFNLNSSLDVIKVLQNTTPDMGGVLKASATDGPMAQTREHILL